MQLYLRACRKWFRWRGRASRAEFWAYWLITPAIAAILATGELLLSSSYWVTVAFLILTLPAGISVTVRRLHDLGYTAWWLLLPVIPVLGVVMLLFWMVTEGQQRPNRHGHNPIDRIH